MKHRQQIVEGLFLLILLCAMPSCLYYPSSETGATYSMAQQREEHRHEEWSFNLPIYIIPRMCAYYKLHPERFKTTGHGEEIQIAGFGAFVKNDTYFNGRTGCHVRDGIIYDPWGQPLHFVQDLNMDGYIEAGGERRPVLRLGNTGLNQEHHFGIFKKSPFKDPSIQPFERIIAATY